ncbi:MAG: response regulator transcription factor [Planctomycetes bacterium]|nr:response regulator transcription factor [Planctomycetota bacterium]
MNANSTAPAPIGRLAAVLGEPPLVRVIEDDAFISDQFARLDGTCGFAVATYSTATSLLAEFDNQRPGCIVIDLVLPDMSGIELLQELAGRDCKLPVVFMSGMARVSEAVKAIQLGSIDFLEKPFEMAQMVDAVQKALHIDRKRREDSNDHDELLRRFASLTPREAEVMEHVVQGAANKEVAARLGLSPKTIEVHRANVMRKTRARSLAELVRLHVAVRT